MPVDQPDPEIDPRLKALTAELEIMAVEMRTARAEIAALRATAARRMVRRVRATSGRTFPRLGSLARVVLDHLPSNDRRYDTWVKKFDTLDEGRRRYLASRVGELDCRPLISVILPVYDPPEAFLRAALDSVLDQIYPDWELCAVDDCSNAAWVPKVLEEYADHDSRIRVVRRETNGHISAASNTALDMARGEWIALLDHDDVLSAHALALAILALSNRPGAGLLYSDEDKLDDRGRRARPFFKPDFDPLLLLAQNYVCHMTMARAELVREVGGFREGLEGAQDWDLILRVSEHLGRDQVVHVPHILYHWREHPGSAAASVDAKPYAVASQHRAVGDHLSRMQEAARVTANAADGLIRVKWPLSVAPPRVSIIIPTRDGTHLRRCLDSLFSGTGYPDFEVLVVDNGSTSIGTRRLLQKHQHWIKVLHDPRPFNFSALNNAAVLHATGDVLCLLNDDCEIIHYDWLEEMVSQLLRDDVGAVGAKLLYPDGSIQHAGVLLGVGGIAGHAHRLSYRHSLGQFGWLFTPRTVSAVTAACMVVRREVFQQLGGLDEVELGISLNDVDLCLRMREAGWRVVWTPFAVLTHHESVTRGLDREVRPEEHDRERAYMRRRWSRELVSDPAYNPNFTLDPMGEQFALAFPPRSQWWC